jgi:predicted nucleic acid-binding protein
MNPPSVFLDDSFLAAVAHVDDDNHEAAVAKYRELVDDFVGQRCLLVGRADQLAAVDNRDLFAPIDKLHVARQHRNAASELVARTAVDLDDAITLVLLRRFRIRKVASFSGRFTNFDDDEKVAVPRNVIAPDAPQSSDDTTLAAETG